MRIRQLSRREWLALSGGVVASRLLGCADPEARTDVDDDLGPSIPIRGELEGPVRMGVVLPAGDSGIPPAGLEESLSGAVAEAARMGAIMAEEEHVFNAELLGIDLEVHVVTAEDGDAAYEAGARLISEDGVFGLVGGYGRDHAMALQRLAVDREVLFLNVGVSDDDLRNESCSRFTFHVEPSAAMYLDALAGWFVQSGYRDWFFVHAGDAVGTRLRERASRALTERHFGAREVGSSQVVGVDFGGTLAEIRASDPDVVVLLLGAEEQLAFLREFEGSGVDAEVTGFPDAAAQTRTFYHAVGTVSPTVRAGYRAAAWEASLDAYGARELNARFRARWNQAMDPAAWAAYQGVKILYEGASLRGTLEANELIAHFERSGTVFDVWKGIGSSFRPWDHQLRQSLYLVEIHPDAEAERERTLLVGELPAIYMPGTDPVERLDQLGDLSDRSQCRFQVAT